MANDRLLEPRHHDHALSGEWDDHRDCHVKPDLLLIYQKSGADILRLLRLARSANLPVGPRPIWPYRSSGRILSNGGNPGGIGWESEERIAGCPASVGQPASGVARRLYVTQPWH